MKEKDLLDKMSLIDMEYVEAAEYPEVHKCEAVRSRRHFKAAVAAAVIFGITAVSVCFGSQITAIAENLFFESNAVFDDYEINEKMNIVEINDIPDKAWDTDYYTLEEVEELLGITLLKSTKNYDSPVPSVDIEKHFAFGGGLISISDRVYYMYNQKVLNNDLDYSRKLGDGAYRVSYRAELFTEFDSMHKYESDYTNAVFIKNYTTAHGLEAAIFYTGGFHALIYHNNIRYEIDMDIWDRSSIYLGNEEETKLLEEYLDTLS